MYVKIEVLSLGSVHDIMYLLSAFFFHPQKDCQKLQAEINTDDKNFKEKWSYFCVVSASVHMDTPIFQFPSMLFVSIYYTMYSVLFYLFKKKTSMGMKLTNKVSVLKESAVKWKKKFWSR